MKINIEVKEVLSKTITVEANTNDEAINMVSKMYKNEDIILDYADFNDVEFEVVDDSNSSDS